MITLTFPKRYQIVGLCSLCIMINYADRSNLSVAIIPMEKEFQWDPTTKGLVLSSFFYGYLFTQLLGGFLADKYGGKHVLSFATFIWSLFTILTPICAKTNFFLLVLCRIIMGAGEGMAFPAVHSLLAQWVPPAEYSRAVAIVTGASYFGSVVSLAISGFISSSHSLGWQWVFYIFGFFGFLWLPFWMFYGFSSPAECHSWCMGGTHRVLGRVENESPSPFSNHFRKKSSKNYFKLEDPEDEDEDDLNITNTKIEPIKKNYLLIWKNIICLKEVWAVMINQFCNSWGFYVLLSWLPSYYKDVFNVDLMEIGIFSILPYVLQGLVGIFAGFLADFLIQNKQWKVITVRKLSQCIGMLGSALFLTLAATINASLSTGVIIVSFALGINAFTLTGVSVSQLDFLPQYAGIVFALGNCFATLPGIIGVQITGWILEKFHSWPAVFIVSCVLYIIGSIVWVFWAGAEPIEFK